MKKITFRTLLFFILVYFNQGLVSLPSQCIYYLTREHWHLTATLISLIAFITGIAWCIKPIFGVFTDFFPIKGYRTKNYLIFNYGIILLSILFVICFGLNIWGLIVLMFLINTATAFNDVCNDTQMVILEKKHNLKGRIQAIQWTSLGIAGLIVSLLGAWIAKKYSINISYKVAYGLYAIVPIITLYYLLNSYQENQVKKKKKLIKKNINQLKNSIKKAFKNKKFVLSLLFISCLNFSPSFGTALMIKMRETMYIDKMFIGWLGATGTVLSLIGYIIYYRKAYKFDIYKLLYFTVIFSALTNLFYLWLPNQWFIFTYSILFGAFNGICFLTILAFFAHIVPKGNEGLFYAFITSINNLTARLGGVFGGVIYDHFGYNINVVVATVTTLLCLLFIPKLKEKR